MDLVPAPGVIGRDVRHGIPFPSATFDLVYHANMLCLLGSTDALSVMRECRRVLKPGGVLRVATEDLEDICRVYLQKLGAVCNGDYQSAKDYEWMLLELFDHPTREYPGGRMRGVLEPRPVAKRSFYLLEAGGAVSTAVALAHR